MYSRCRDRDVANDVTDEAFVRALTHWHRVGTMQSPAGWVHAVAANTLRRLVRRQAMEARFVHSQYIAEGIWEDRCEVWDVVELLPPRQRAAVLLRFVTDLPEADIAAAMGVTRGTVSSTLASARCQLARLLTDESDN
jgi:RNA polymerase sigma factor (sigma-70 family)